LHSSSSQASCRSTEGDFVGVREAAAAAVASSFWPAASAPASPPPWLLLGLGWAATERTGLAREGGRMRGVLAAAILDASRPPRRSDDRACEGAEREPRRVAMVWWKRRGLKKGG